MPIHAHTIYLHIFLHITLKSISIIFSTYDYLYTTYYGYMMVYLYDMPLNNNNNRDTKAQCNTFYFSTFKNGI